MNLTLLQSILDIIFQFFTPYLGPVVFLFVVVLFAEKIVEVIYESVMPMFRRR